MSGSATKFENWPRQLRLFTTSRYKKNESEISKFCFARSKVQHWVWWTWVALYVVTNSDSTTLRGRKWNSCKILPTAKFPPTASKHQSDTLNKATQQVKVYFCLFCIIFLKNHCCFYHRLKWNVETLKKISVSMYEDFLKLSCQWCLNLTRDKQKVFS